MGLKKQTRYRELDQIINGFAGNADILAWAACCLWGAKRKARALEVLDQAVELRPDAAELLWQRASYLRDMGNERRAIEDLMHLLEVLDPQRQPTPKPSDSDEIDVLNLPGPYDDDEVLFERSARFCLPNEFLGEGGEQLDLDDDSAPLQQLAGINPYVVSALRQLGELSPEKYEEAKRKPCITSLSHEAQSILFAAPPSPEKREPEAVDLIREKKWAEVVALIQPRVEPPSDTWSLEDALHLFMAYWGLGNDQSLPACGKRAIERFRERTRLPGRPGLGPSELQILSLVYWKIGKSGDAKKLLDNIDYIVPRSKGKSIFSYWRYERVSNWDLFIEDCHEQRLMFHGAKRLPPFLE